MLSLFFYYADEMDFQISEKKKVTGITHTCFSNKSYSQICAQKLETLILAEVNLMLACIIANR